jgi:hypothetical protein
MQLLTGPAPTAHAASATTSSAAQWRARVRIGVLAALAVAAAVSGAPRWAVLLASLACLAIPVAVAIQDGLSAARALLFIRSAARRPGPRPKEMRYLA